MTGPTLDVRAHNGYRHEAYLFDDGEQFVRDTVAFVREGVDAGQPVLVAVTPPHLEALREALGSAKQAVQFMDMTQLGANPGRIIPAWRAFIDRYGMEGQPLRGVGEPIWDGRRPAELAECQLHEALLNLAVSPATPLWLRCPYDASVLPESVIEEAQRSHPMIVERDEYRGSALYGGSTHVDDLLGSELPDSLAVVETFDFGADELSAVRQIVLSHAFDAGLREATCHDLGLVVHELATNSVRHGGGAGTLRIARDATALVAEVQDRGQFSDALAGRRISRPSDEGGRGLWLAHHLSDLVQVRRTESGTTVRVHTWL